MLFLIVSLVLGGMVFLAGVSLNSYIFFVAGCRVGRTTSALWFLNQAIANLIFFIFLPFRCISIVIPDLEWAERLSSTITSLHMFSSAFFLTALSVDRCILVARPEWAWNLRTHTLAFGAVLGTWALSLGFSLRYGDHLESLLSPASISMNFQLDEGRVKAAVVFQFLVGFLIPLVLILIPTFYIVLAAKLRRNRLIQSTKPLKILLGLIPTFFLSWLPYHVFSFLLISAKYPLPLLDMGRTFAGVLTYLSTCLNPIFYLTMEEEFLRYQQRARNTQTTDHSGPETAE
ncbi:chemokine-like receptor 1 [Mauremys reevesii]|uniref:chemokine-like receptor 1 n=1 Tax=Mauremys reevesii TaxID=260615 RepID=UPI00193EFA89|nr:chemokine-like receptor 1 [Mauremys reevesii]XP_039369063.1 chemokine-like receptor 1 [Mauremys reevesii]